VGHFAAFVKFTPAAQFHGRLFLLPFSNPYYFDYNSAPSYTKPMKKTATPKRFDAHGGKLVDLLAKKPRERDQLYEELMTLPKITLSNRQICDLEMIMTGAFSPLTGFMTENEYKSVLAKMRLPKEYQNAVWTIPIVLDVPAVSTYKIGDKVGLYDKYNFPLAILEISSIYTPDKKFEALKVYGSTDTTHFGVNYLMNETGTVYLGGKISGLNLTAKYDFEDLRHTPQQIREWFKKNNWHKIVAFQTRNPIHKAHFELLKSAINEHGAKLLIHPSVGLTKDGDIDYVTRVKIYKKIQEKYLPKNAKVSLLPLAMRMGGPREAVWHAIIRRNHGATHFIVGRDHAGPGKDASGRDFYGPYDAQKLSKKFAEEIGIVIVDPKEMVYVEEHKKYFPINKVPKNSTIKNISGTKFREMLRSGEEIPEWFSFPEIISELREGLKKESQTGVTVFFTGLSGSGKSTIANMLGAELTEKYNKRVTLLDGDVVREHLSKGLGFSKEDRNENIRRIGFVAAQITKHGGIAICSAIAPYSESRNKNRERISKHGTYIEVYVEAPLATCEKRDPKGLYKKARKGLMKGFTGIDDPYETPINPEITLHTKTMRPSACVKTLVDYLKSKQLI